jgi:hypothetical protein
MKRPQFGDNTTCQMQIYFASHFDPKLRSGTSFMRSYQLWQLAKPHFDAVGMHSATTSSLRHRNSLLVLNKYMLLKCTLEQLDRLSKAGNVLMGDPVDGKIDEDILSACDALLASSLTQLDWFHRAYPRKRIAYIGHHVDPRIGDIAPPADKLRLAYFGEILNAAFVAPLRHDIVFIHVDTGNAGNTEWMKKLHNFNAHYAMRAHRDFDGFKPFIKGFVAAHCRCPIIVGKLDDEACRFLGDDYPYQVRAPTVGEVMVVTERMRAGFGGPEWQEALARMRAVKNATSLSVVNDQIRETFAPELASHQRRTTFSRLRSWMEKTR